MNVELFPCSGGMAEGFRRAGVVFDVAFDYSSDACDSYEANHGHRPVQMDVRDLVRLARQGFNVGGGVDLLVADPPCTPWSRAGKRQGREDERDMLEETVELIELWRPRAYLIGNVPGLDDSTQWHVVQEILGRLARGGYCIADYAQLDAADYGVPQHRVRPFWFGHLAGPCLRWPAPTHGPSSRNLALPGCALKPWVTCREALSVLPRAEWGKPWRMRRRKCNGKVHGSVMDRPARVVGTSNLSDGNVLQLDLAPTRSARSWHNAHPPSDADAPARTITTKRQAGHGGGACVLRDRHPPSSLDAPSRVVKTNTGRKGSGAELALNRHDSPVHTSEIDAPARTITTQCRAAGHATTFEWPWERPSTTVTCRGAVPPPGHHPETGSIMSQPGVVLLSEKAAAILQGFPPSWVFSGRTKVARWGQIGMAMPPGLAEPVARAVVEQMRTVAGACGVSATNRGGKRSPADFYVTPEPAEER